MCTWRWVECVDVNWWPAELPVCVLTCVHIGGESGVGVGPRGPRRCRRRHRSLWAEGRVGLSSLRSSRWAGPGLRG